MNLDTDRLALAFYWMIAACILSTFPLVASAGTAPVTPRSIKYEIRKGQAVVGHARIDFNRPKRKKRGLMQKVVVRATVDPLRNPALRIDVDSHSWLGANQFPVRAKWSWSSFGNDRTVSARYAANSIDGIYQSQKKTFRLKTRKSNPIGDVVSFAAWLAGQKLNVGQTLKTTTYTGLKLYNVTLKVGDLTTIDLPRGSRNVLPIDAEAVRPGKTRNFRLWVDPVSGSLVRLSFTADYVGGLDMVLVRERR
jgi:hypothetical protein